MGGESWSVGGYRTDSITGKVAKVGMATGTLNNSGACMQISGANYQVTAGKTFYIVGVQYPYLTTGAGQVVLCYADDATMTTNRVNLGFGYSLTLNFLLTVIPVFGASVAATKYVGIFNAGNSGSSFLIIHGYEV